MVCTTCTLFCLTGWCKEHLAPPAGTPTTLHIVSSETIAIAIKFCLPIALYSLHTSACGASQWDSAAAEAAAAVPWCGLLATHPGVQSFPLKPMCGQQVLLHGLMVWGSALYQPMSHH